jgi:hypothetical protein
MKTATSILTTTFLACAALAGPASAGEVERGWTLLHEDLDVFIDPARDLLRIEGVLVARLDHDETSPGPMLGMNARDPLMRFESVSAPGATVELNTTHADLEDVLLTTLSYAEPKRRGDEVRIEFACRRVANGRQLVLAESVALASWVEGSPSRTARCCRRRRRRRGRSRRGRRSGRSRARSPRRRTR